MQPYFITKSVWLKALVPSNRVHFLSEVLEKHYNLTQNCMDYLSFIGKAPDVYDRLVSFIFLTLSYRYSNKNFGL